MPTTPPKTPADYIQPLNINGLEGRMLHVPAPGKRSREILLMYGHHAKIERWWGLIQNLNMYGAVTMPDLPGFGGMDSFSKINKRPTIDNFADYLASFVKLRYRRKRLTIVGVSFGFIVATRMLQKYPELVKKVDLVVSIGGFMHQDDFHFPANTRRQYSRFARLLATRPMAAFIRAACLNHFVLNTFYVRLPAAKRRFLEVDPLEFKEMVEFEVVLWQANDVRTHWLTTSEFLKLDNCKVRVDLPLWHVASQGDHYFNNEIVAQHMQVVFSDYNQATAITKAHMPSVLADKKGLAVLVPPALRRVLNAKP